MIPAGYEEYLQDGVRTREVQLDHFAETLAIMQVTYGLNMKQLADEVNLPRCTVWRYIHKEKHVRRGYKEMILTKLKQIITEGKASHVTYAHMKLKRRKRTL